MRIAVNTRFLLKNQLEGVGWYTHELLQRIVRAHPEDEFLFLFDRPYDPAFLYGPNVQPVVVFPPARHPVLWYAWFEWAVPQVLKRYQPEAFFSPDSFLSLRAQTPTLLTVHDLIPLQDPQSLPFGPRRYYQHFLPRYVRKATRIAVVSAYVQQVVTDLLGVPTSRISVVYNGYRETFRPLAPEEQAAVRLRYAEGRPYFLHAGAIHPRKNLPRLIKAFDRFKTHAGAPALLLIAGRLAWDSEPARRAVQAARHRDDIRFLGYLPEAELARLYGAAWGVVNVSLNEGFGLPIVEAFACDTPVLCSNRTALAEVAGDAALQVDPESVEEIASGLSKLYFDAALRKALIDKGQLRRQQFRWDAAAQQIYQLIVETAAG